MKPLRRLTQKDVEWCWDKVEDKAFTEVKQLVTQALLFAYYSQHKGRVIQCDASRRGLGAAIMQEWRPLAYASRALTDPETRYATIKNKWDVKHTPTSPFNSKANGKVEAAVKSDKRFCNRTARGGDDFYQDFLPSAKFWPSGGRGDKVAPGAWPKAWSSKKQSLRIVCAIFCRQQSSTKKINLDFSLEQLRWLLLKWLILFQKETQGTRLGFPSLQYWVFFTPTLRVCKAGRRSVVPWRHDQIFSDP